MDARTLKLPCWARCAGNQGKLTAGFSKRRGRRPRKTHDGCPLARSLLATGLARRLVLTGSGPAGCRSAGCRGHASQVVAGGAQQARRARGAIIVTAEAAERVHLRRAFGAIVVAAKAADGNSTRHRLGAVVITAGWLGTRRITPGEAEDLAPVDRLSGCLKKQRRQDG